jgi:two-component system sensor histidine kinase VicK
MNRSIKWRLVTIYVVLVIIVMIASGSLVIWVTSYNEYKTMEEELVNAAKVIVEATAAENTSIDEVQNDLKTIISGRGELYQSKITCLLDKDGNLIYSSSAISDSLEFYYPQVMAVIYGQELDELDSVNYTGIDTEYKGYAKGIYVDEQLEFIVYIMASTEPVKDTINTVINVLILAIILAIIIAVILGLIFSSFITKPIVTLSNKAREMASGNLDKGIEVMSNDEIGELTRDFNIMATSLNNTLREISSEKNKLEIVFEYMTDGILVFNTDGQLTYYNKASEVMLEIGDNHTFDNIISIHFSSSFEDVLNQLKGKTIQHIIEVGEKYYNICMAKYFDQDKVVIGIICVIQDITEYKKLEKMQKEFVANVSHELRTPLTTIKSYTETLIDGVDNPDISSKFLNVINHESDRMTDLVQDLLELSRLDNKQIKIELREISLNSIVEDSVEKYQIHARKKNQILTYYKPDDNYNIIGDAGRIEQVIKNIVSNAVKYSLEEAAIDVYLYEKEDEVIVKIQDTGMGISKEDLKRIFERFYRVDKARSRKMGGTGLGLSIAKEIMNFHGGTITVESEISKGSTFYLHFPRKR